MPMYPLPMKYLTNHNLTDNVKLTKIVNTDFADDNQTSLSKEYCNPIEAINYCFPLQNYNQRKLSDSECKPVTSYALPSHNGNANSGEIIRKGILSESTHILKSKDYAMAESLPTATKSSLKARYEAEEKIKTKPRTNSHNVHFALEENNKSSNDSMVHSNKVIYKFAPTSSSSTLSSKSRPTNGNQSNSNKSTPLISSPSHNNNMSMDKIELSKPKAAPNSVDYFPIEKSYGSVPIVPHDTGYSKPIAPILYDVAGPVLGMMYHDPPPAYATINPRKLHKHHVRPAVFTRTGLDPRFQMI